MSIKILGGFARGQSLKVIKSDFVKPTAVMLRRRLFDSIQDLSDIIFVDICAGSGSVGFEAWSRGAKQVFFNEKNRRVCDVLLENKENMVLKNHHKKIGEIYVTANSAELFIEQFKIKYLQFSEQEKLETLIFLDPPYSEKGIYQKLISQISSEWFSGKLLIESGSDKGFSPEELGLPIEKLFSQGNNFILVSSFSVK